MKTCKVGDKFIIEIDSIMTNKKGTLYGIKGFNSLVFDENGLDRLTNYEDGFIAEFSDAMNKGYEKGLSDAWECMRKLRDKDAEELKEIFGLPFTKNVIDVLIYLAPQEAIDKLKAWEEKHEIKVGDVIISNEGNKAVVQFITPNGEWECFNKCTYFTLNREKQKLWNKTGKHIDLTEIFNGLEVEG